MANFIMGIISLSISVVILANVFISTVKGTTTCVPGSLGANCNGTVNFGTNATGVGGVAFTPSETVMWGILSLIAIVGMVYGVMQVFGIG
jgi:hypothetical protein